jgi:hypothetical protein
MNINGLLHFSTRDKNQTPKRLQDTILYRATHTTPRDTHRQQSPSWHEIVDSIGLLLRGYAHDDSSRGEESGAIKTGVDLRVRRLK